MDRLNANKYILHFYYVIYSFLCVVVVVYHVHIVLSGLGLLKKFGPMLIGCDPRIAKSLLYGQIVHCTVDELYSQRK